MIFRPRLTRLILEGRKTQTRRVIKEGQSQPPYSVGRTYAIQRGRGKPSIGRIEILAATDQALGEIQYQDARAEGFKSRDEFFAYWEELHGVVDPDLRVWVYLFTLAEAKLFLAPRLGQGERLGDVRDYVHDPQRGVQDEDEAVPADWLKRHAEQRREEFADFRQMQMRELDELPLAVRVQRLEELEVKGANVSRELRAVRKSIEAGEKKAGLRIAA